MTGTPLVFGECEREALRKLRERAAFNPLDMQHLTEQLKDPLRKESHVRQMTAQTAEIPFGFLVTFSIEHGHPGGTARHMSMSSPAKSRVPSPEAVWMVCEALGFVGSYAACAVWIEELKRGDGRAQAVNVVQIIA